MTDTTLQNSSRRSFGILTAIGGFFAGIGNGLVLAAESTGRMRKIEKLRAMSDAELAEIGLKREDIVRHVFHDLLYV